MSTKKQRMISAADLEFRGYLTAPHEAKPTALGLWTKSTDVYGRRECSPELIAGEIYPGEAATDRVVEHLLMLMESGFLTIYKVDGADWIALARPLKADLRGTEPPPHGPPRTSVAVGGAGVRERVEAGERAGEWAVWEREQERSARPPARPLLLDAPPIGCPDHPNGRYDNCGPCGTARRRHDKWVAQQRYTEANDRYDAEHEGEADDDEPF